MNKELKHAISTDPKGVICYRCKAVNEWYDDCGWFYANAGPKRYSRKPVCEACWNDLGCSTCER
jgi:hypothetical protein